MVEAPGRHMCHLRLSQLVIFAILIFAPCNATQGAELRLSRPARPWEFVSATGQRAGLFGDEGGNLEAWIYPLKIVRNFHLQFLTDGRSLPASTLARTVTVRPESSTIVYTGDTFSVKETLFVPVTAAGAVIIFEVETAHPLEIEAIFERDFQLEWPAALGATYGFWEPSLKAFHLGEEQKKYVALLGSLTGAVGQQEYQTNYSSSRENSIRLGTTTNGKDTKVIAIAASVNGRPEAEREYQRLLSDYARLEEESAQYYRDYVSRTIGLDLPDHQMQQAYDWARVSVIQGLVTNPYLGTGLVAGYRTSGTSQRPGFAWFFGRDSFWTALALDAENDFQTARSALEFVSKYQRTDGKIPHEIAQGANFVNWFVDYPYPYASADATPLYIIAADDYVTSSGDVEFAREKWDSLWKAYQFLRSTYDSQGLPQNFGFGHGWVEGGPLLPVKTELYQSGVGAEALASLSHLARAAGKEEIAKRLSDEFRHQRQLVEQNFWSQDAGTYVFALDEKNQKVMEASVLATVPMWFGLLDEQKAAATLTKLSAPEHQADWGMRIISSQSPKYDPGGYHYGSVWPLFTGWASMGEYRYHRSLPGYSNLRSNALLTLDGSLGHVTEVLSGDYYQGLSTSSPHQMWSAAMIISPLLRGLLGLETNAASHRVVLEPHLPADWTFFAIRQVRVGDAVVDFNYQRSSDRITLKVESSNQIALEFSPSLSLRARIIGAELNGTHIEFPTRTTDNDQHPAIHASLRKGTSTLVIRSRDDFGVSYAASLPPLGGRSVGLRVISESWSSTRDALTLDVAGTAGHAYELDVWNPGNIGSAEGARLENGKLLIQIPPAASEAYIRKQVTLHFTARKEKIAPKGNRTPEAINNKTSMSNSSN